MPFFISKPIFPGTWGVLSGAKSWFRFWFLTPCPAIQLTVFIGVQRGKIWTAELCWLLIRKLCKNLTQPPFLNDGSHVIKKQMCGCCDYFVQFGPIFTAPEVQRKEADSRGAERKSFSLPLFLLHKHITSAQFNYKWCGRFNQMLSKCVNFTCLSQTKLQELFNVSIRDGNFLLGQYELIKKREIRESKRGNWIWNWFGT